MSLPASAFGVPSSASAMETVLTLAERYATLPCDLFLLGPTGVGKGHLAERIHRASGRAGKFVTVTGGALTDSLWTSQLFGHVAGAFTDAKHKLQGAFEEAVGGTLFLDEIQHWSPNIQSGLLRALGDRRFRPLGAERDVDLTCRILFATTMAPDGLVAEHDFLPDLRHRLPALMLRLPALAARRDEILPLLYQFTAQILTEFGWDQAHFHWAPSAIRGLLLYPWPGNIRELRNLVTRTLAQMGPAPVTEIEVADLDLPPAPVADLGELLAPETFRRVVTWALEITDGSRTAAAALLGVHRNTITRYIARWGLPARRASSDAPLLVHLGADNGALAPPVGA